MSLPLLTLELRLEHDIVHARQRARKLASLLGFEAQDQSRIATAVSEMARNAFSYAGGGKVEFSIGAEDSEFVVRVIAAFRLRLEANDWMTPETRDRALEKLVHLRVKVGYPDEWETY